LTDLAHKKKDEALLQDLIAAAHRLNIEVRTERLFREVGYRAHSGRCRLKGREMIIVDRDVPLRDQVAFLAAELDERGASAAQLPTRIGRLQKE
jgi:hypothetical protein